MRDHIKDIYRDHIKDIFVVLIIIMIGTLVRFPITNIGEIDTSILNDPDSYLYARRAVEFYNKPISEWELFTYRSDDPLMNYLNSEGDHYTTNFLPICVALICKIFKAINIENLIYFFNIFICPLSAIPAYFFVKNHSNIVGGSIAGFLMSVSPSYFFHTMYGYFDTDALIMLFALTLVLSQIDCFLSKSKLKQIALGVVAIVTATVFSLVWEEYYVYVAIALGLSVVILIACKPLKLKLNLPVPIISLILMITSCLVFAGSRTIEAIKAIFTNMLGLSSSSSWPDPSKYITELVRPDFFGGGINDSLQIQNSGVVNWLGGLPLFIALVLSLIFVVDFYFIKKRTDIDSKEHSLIFILILIWMITVSVLLPSGIRFVQLVALPFNIFIGLSIGIFIDTFGDLELKIWKKDLIAIFVGIMLLFAFARTNFYFSIVLCILFVAIVICVKKVSALTITSMFVIAILACPVIREYRICTMVTPFVSEDFVQAAEYLADNTDSDATIVSWWGYGYFLQYATNRQVVADGGTYNGSYFYWLGNAYISKDENLTVGICKMLQNGNIEAEKIAEEYFGNPANSTTVLKEILALDVESARDILSKKYDLTTNQIDRLLSCSHPAKDSDVYLILNKELSTNVSVMAYNALWDFTEEKEYITKYDSDTGEVIYPSETKESIVVKYLEDKKFDTLNEVYSNDKVSIYKIVDNR